MADKIYCGSGIEKFDGNLVEISINLSKIKGCTDEIFSYGEDKFIKLKVCKKREVDEYGKTHYVEVNTWKPDPKKAEATQPNSAESDEDLPF